MEGRRASVDLEGLETVGRAQSCFVLIIIPKTGAICVNPLFYNLYAKTLNSWRPKRRAGL